MTVWRPVLYRGGDLAGRTKSSHDQGKHNYRRGPPPISERARTTSEERCAARGCDAHWGPRRRPDRQFEPLSDRVLRCTEVAAGPRHLGVAPRSASRWPWSVPLPLADAADRRAGHHGRGCGRCDVAACRVARTVRGRPRRRGGTLAGRRARLAGAVMVTVVGGINGQVDDLRAHLSSAFLARSSWASCSLERSRRSPSWAPTSPIWAHGEPECSPFSSHWAARARTPGSA